MQKQSERIFRGEYILKNLLRKSKQAKMLVSAPWKYNIHGIFVKFNSSYMKLCFLSVVLTSISEVPSKPKSTSIGSKMIYRVIRDCNFWKDSRLTHLHLQPKEFDIIYNFIKHYSSISLQDQQKNKTVDEYWYDKLNRMSKHSN